VVAATTTQAQTVTLLHDFTNGADGYYPTTGLAVNRAGNLYGTAGPAAVFRMSHRGSGWIFTPIYSFTNVPDGWFGNQLTVAADGSLYGSTQYGGILDCEDETGCGTVVHVMPPPTVCKTAICPWSEEVLYRFNGYPDGSAPSGNVVLDQAGNVYGVTTYGGTSDAGVIYELTPSGGGWTRNIIYNFQVLEDGGAPFSGLTIDDAGNLYGTTTAGGDASCYPSRNGCGTVYELARSGSGWTYNVLYAFQSQSQDGFNSLGGVIFDTAGNLYGDTEAGGPNGGGTVFELQPTNGGWNYKLLYGLTGNANTSGANGSMAIDSNGDLYGLTASEGAFGEGNAFKLTASGGNWIYTDLHDFAGGSNDGAVPYDGPIVDASGNIYGTATFGGTGNCSYGCGVVFEITP